MLKVSDIARDELLKILESDMAKDKDLILFYQGSGCRGPVLGMTLGEHTEDMIKIDSNRIVAYIETSLNESLGKIGDIHVDYITNDLGSGYSIVVGEDRCASGGCSCSGGGH